MADLNLSTVTWRSTGASPQGGIRLSFHRNDGSILRIELARGCALTVADTIEDYLDRSAPSPDRAVQPDDAKAPDHG